MICQFCNSRISNGSKFCSQCGAPTGGNIEYPNNLYRALRLEQLSIEVFCHDCNKYFWARFPGVNTCPHCEARGLLSINYYPETTIAELESIDARYLNNRDLGGLYNKLHGKVLRQEFEDSIERGKVYSN